MRKIILISLFLILSVQVFACDACGAASSGGYIGILPQYTRHFIGMRYQFRYFSSVSASNPQGGTRNQEFYHTWNIMGRISPHKRWQIYINIPIHYFTQNDQQVKNELAGPGDIWTLAQYQMIRTPDSSMKKMRQSWFVGGGIKLPTGRYNMYNSNGFYDRNMQPGTGSWDVLLSSQYTIRWNGWGCNAEVNARLSTLNPDYYRYGHKMSASIKGFYWAKGKNVTCLTTAGIAYDFSSKDIYLNQTLANSGGNMVSATASSDLYIKKMAIGVEVKIPFYSRMSSGLLSPGPQIMTQLMFMF